MQGGLKAENKKVACGPSPNLGEGIRGKGVPTLSGKSDPRLHSFFNDWRGGSAETLRCVNIVRLFQNRNGNITHKHLINSSALAFYNFIY